MLTQQQTEQKIQLIHAAAILTAISLPSGSPEEKIGTQHERWYQFLTTVAMPDETVYVSPNVPLPAPAPIVPGDPTQLQILAKALAPLLAAIPGPAGPIAAAAAGVIANAPLPGLTTIKP